MSRSALASGGEGGCRQSHEKYGTGCTDSQFLNGTIGLHVELEGEYKDANATHTKTCMDEEDSFLKK